MAETDQAWIALSSGDERELDDLEDWIRAARIGGLRVEGKRAEAEAGAMGLGLVEALTVGVGAIAALTQLVTAIHGWLNARKSRAKGKVRLVIPGRGEIEIEGEAPLDELLRRAEAALDARA
jgi:hypothetical protein